MALRGKISIGANLNNTKDNVDLSTPEESLSQSLSKGVISTEMLYHDTITLSANEIKIIDLADDSLSDVYGESIGMSNLTAFYIAADSVNEGDFILSGGINAFLNDTPNISASEGLAFLTDIDMTTDSKLYFINGALSGYVDLIVTGE